MRAGILSLCLLLGAAPASAAIANWETPNGARVYFVRSPELPMVDVRVVFDAGSARDGAKPGLAALTNSMLEEGAGGISAEIISERFEEVGAQFHSGTGRDSAWLGLRSLTDPASLEPALATFGLVLTHPDFPQRAFERERKRTQILLKQREQDPADRAADALYAALYGAHPYASPVRGTEQGLRALERADLVAFFAQHYGARNAVVPIVGDLDREQAEALARRLLEPLPEGSRPEPLPPVPALAAPVEIRIPHASTQTHVLLGAVGIARGDPDFFPLYVGNHALGGNAPVSRLTDLIREQHGLSYSVSSHFLAMRSAGPFMAGLETRNDQAEEALGLLRGSLAKFFASGPTGKELQSSIQNISSGFPLRIDSNSKIMDYLVLIGVYGLPLDYLDSFVGRVQAVTEGQAREAFRRRLSGARFVTVIVGGEATASRGTRDTLETDSYRR